MQSRKDQVQAYFFVVGRLFSALTHGKPDIVEPPNRRFGTAAVLGVILSGLLVGVFGIIGLYSPGTTTAWQQPGSIIVDKDTGARYLFLNGALRPVLNFTSARLAAGSSAPVVAVSTKSLTGVPVGPTIGIPDAPDAAPTATSLDTGPWTLCLNTPAATPSQPTVTLALDNPSGTALTGDQGVLAASSDFWFLIWQGHRYRLPSMTVINALGYSAASVLSVSDSWANAIPAAQDIDVPNIGQLGSAGPVINGNQSRVGQILETRNAALGTDVTYVVLSNGIALLNPMSEALLLGSPDTRNAYPNGDIQPIPVDSAALASVPVVTSTELDGYPPLVPKLVNGTLTRAQALCARFDPGDQAAGTPLSMMPVTQLTAISTATGPHEAGQTIDRVAIPAGVGVLARELPAAGASPGSEFLVTDDGTKFPLGDTSVAGTLGYSAASAVTIPNELLAVLPTGPVLSAQAALANADGA